MAKKKKDPGVNFAEEVRRLRASGPERLYVLCGEEEYLREQFLAEIKKLCLPGGEDDFCYHRFDGASLTMQALADAADAVPFLSERTLLEVRGCDTNKLVEAESARLLALLEDIPDYCTLVFVMDPVVMPDGKRKVTKAFQKHGHILRFQGQEGSALIKWVARRFDAYGKRITVPDAEHLILITGGLMSRMIPEIDKLGAYARGTVVTRADIDAVVQKVPDAVIYDMTDCIADRRGDEAMRQLAELLSDKNSEPVAMLAAVGSQMRRLYAAKCASEARMSEDALADLLGLKLSFIARMLMRSARGFTTERLERAVALCAEADYNMKHSKQDNEVILQELLLRLLAETPA